MGVEKVEYGGWPNCYRLFNDQIELIATSDVGPRIIRLAFIGDENLFAEFEEQMGMTGGDEWRIYGGHRLWHAPESKPRTYYPDNSPVQVEAEGFKLKLTQPVEETTGIGKEIEIRLLPSSPVAEVIHRLRNENLWAVKLAPWALTAMAPGGYAIIPQPEYIPHEEKLLPARPMAIWHYTDMSDPRWRWGRRFILLKQSPSMSKPLKLGVGNEQGWAAYRKDDKLFLKRYTHFEGMEYPDFGCSTEVFTNDRMLELETLGPFVELQPGEVVEHVEIWGLFRVPDMGESEEEMDERLRAFVAMLDAAISEEREG
ncbi:hypothetical protein DRP77_01090 [Candidatus Poribacteria bacterium]|nr:MAG: hypothetical protein DRP77_01090 [Candidatus Poribacteria bacterium]